MKINGARVPVEFKVVNTPDLPPIVISQNENDNPKVVINTHHKIWISYIGEQLQVLLKPCKKRWTLFLIHT